MSLGHIKGKEGKPCCKFNYSIFSATFHCVQYEEFPGHLLLDEESFEKFVGSDINI